MKKEITICDNCKRQLNEGEQFVTRCISSSTYDTRVEDVCMGCVYPSTTTTDDAYKPLLKHNWTIL